MKAIIPALVVLLAGLAVLAVAHQILRRRREGGEHGDYWTRVTFLLVVTLGPALLASGWLEVLRPTWWSSGHHLHLDVTGAFGWSVFTCYLVALASPFLVWLGVAAVTWRFPGGDEGRWLAGGIGFTTSRSWVLLCAVPAAAVVLYTLPRLGGGTGAYPGAAWSTLAVFCLSLLGVATSAGRIVETAEPVAEIAAEPDAASAPWLRDMREGGIQLRTLTGWPARSAEDDSTNGPSPDGPSANGTSRGDLLQRLEVMGARQVAPELVDALDGLLHTEAGASGAALTRLVLAPDECGQQEIVALAAHLLDRRYHAHTLVVTAGGAEELAAGLGRWLPDGQVTAVTSRSEVPTPERVWVCDAGTLSDRLLPQLQDPRRLERIGLVVWWDVHDYSGVLAANLWAISRRLHRLLRVHGRRDVRTLAFLRGAAHDDAQTSRFVRRLLPLAADTPEIRVAARYPKAVELHLVESHHAYLAESEELDERWQHLPLVTARVSAEHGWATRLDVPPDLGDRAADFLANLKGTPTAEHLLADATSTAARIRKLGDADVLSLAEIFSQGGRAHVANGNSPNGNSPEGAHHVALVRPDNPYAAWVLEREATNGTARTARRLISAEARESVIHRHLLLALAELPDTRGELKKSFLQNEELIGRTLEEIAHEGNLSRREVRHLDAEGHLVIDHEYRSRRLAERGRRPLDTVGANLIEVRDPTGDGDGVCLRIDRERLTIEAYPQRVFLHAGRRYRIGEWASNDEVAARGWLPCERHDGYTFTWRLRQPGIFDVETVGSPVTVGVSGRSFRRHAADLFYEEEVTGVVRLNPRPSSISWPRPETQAYEAVRTSFATRALLLGFSRPAAQADEAAGPVALCQALRHVLPVHLGVSENDLELVPLLGYETPDGTYGLAVVDLYPGGIGLVEGLQDDDLLAQLLRRAYEWLSACSCKAGRGCCLRTPSARAAAMDDAPDHRAAMSLLKQVV